MANKINIRSLDFDGCIFNNRYMMLNTKNRLIDTNLKLIDEITSDILHEKYDEIIFMVGSNRQSLEIDDVNGSNGTGSCFPAIRLLCSEFQNKVNPIKCKVDEYLLSDTYGKTTIGRNFEKALNEDLTYQFSPWLFDDSKLTIIYAQIHKAATDYPCDDIVYDFYDDRYLGSDDILKNLSDFFTANKDLIPHNLKLRFHHYAGNEINDIADIQGEGKIDTFYNEHINLMIHCGELSLHNNINDVNNMLSALTDNHNLAKFKKKRLLKLDDRKKNATYYSYTTPDIFYKKQPTLETAIFNHVYLIGNERTDDGLRWLRNTNRNINIKINGITALQKHANEGHDEAVAFLIKGGCSNTEKSNQYNNTRRLGIFHAFKEKLSKLLHRKTESISTDSENISKQMR